MSNLKFSKKRNDIKHCPCGKSNHDGKFVPYDGYADKGYCYSCSQAFQPEKETKKVPVYKLVTFYSIEDYSKKCYKASLRKKNDETNYYYLPKSISKNWNRNNIELPDWFIDENAGLKNDLHFAFSALPAFSALSVKEPSLIDFDLFGKSLINWLDVEQIAEQNNLVKYLLSIFSPHQVRLLIHYYNIGTSKHWPGATIFWQADLAGNIRSGKVMHYNTITGKRDKKRFTWVHTILNITDFNLNQCLFGLHLAKESNKPIAIVESEKSAIVCNQYMPQFTWLAAGGKDGLKIEKLKAIKHKKIILFPDLNAFDEWSEKAKDFNDVGYSIAVNDYLQSHATAEQKAEGLDLADFLTTTNNL